MLEVLVFIIVVASIASIVMSFISSGSTGKGYRFKDKVARLNEGAFPSIMTWYIMENYPIMLFYAIGQVYLLPGRVGDISNSMLLSNKIIIYIFLVYAILLGPL